MVTVNNIHELNRVIAEESGAERVNVWDTYYIIMPTNGINIKVFTCGLCGFTIYIQTIKGGLIGSLIFNQSTLSKFVTNFLKVYGS